MNEKNSELVEKYMKPELEIVELSNDNVIVTSFIPDENEGPLNPDS